MQQVLFHIPILKDWFPPDGLPVNGFGVMLFITFVACVWLLGQLAVRWGTKLPKERVQDLVIVVFLAGLTGARITYMVQYEVPWQNFFRIWEGGIVLYGGIVTGILAFLLFYRIVLRRLGVSLWKLADAAGPGLALGIALGRVGCFLNGCCYGHVAPESCPSVAFPVLTCPSRDMVVDRQGYQTPTGFTVKPGADDTRSVVDRVEPDSAAERAGLQPGDRIVAVNGRPNGGVLTVLADKGKAADQAKTLDEAVKVAEGQGAVAERVSDSHGERVRIVVDDLSRFDAVKRKLNADLLFLARVFDSDLFLDEIHNWPRGRESLTLDVERGMQRVTIGPFTPRTLGLHPTQVYETVSMLLLMAFLLAYYPFRHHDGQVFTLFVFFYAIHRFLNETLRNDTDIVGIPQLHMTLSQNVSVLMLLFAVCLEVGLRRAAKPAPTNPTTPEATPAAAA
jgi:prolipoprotein diacylglyceryltransferase